MDRIYLLLIVFFLSTGAACRKQAAPMPSDTTPAAAAPSLVPASSPSEPQPALGTDPIEYEGYRLTRETRMGKWDETHEVETAYGLLKFGSKTVMRFDAEPSMFGNEIAFGLVPALGPERKQIYVQRTGYREQEDWIINLHPSLRVVYHSTDFGFYNSAQTMDIDHDGSYELLTRVTDYVSFADLPTCCSPVVTAILKYDQRAKKYVPANYLFQEEALKGTDEELAKARGAGTALEFREHLLNAVLRYLYAGKEREGWEFFEKEYNKPDKADLRLKIRRQLAHEPVFQYLHPHRTS